VENILRALAEAGQPMKALDPPALREIRKSRELTMREASELSGISSSEISRVERGLVTPGLKTLAALAHAYGVIFVIDRQGGLWYENDWSTIIQHLFFI
jgi:transcriptional regulator with XRE-family HTH domain